MRLEWQDPDDPHASRGGGGRGGFRGTVLALTALGAVCAIILSAFAYTTLQTAYTPAPPVTTTTSSSAAGTGTFTAQAGPPLFGSLPPASAANFTTLSCSWAGAGQAGLTCLAGSTHGQAVLVVLELLNPAPAPAEATMNLTLNDPAWSVDCRLMVGANPPPVVSGDALTLPAGTSLVDCSLAPPAPGSVQFDAEVA